MKRLRSVVVKGLVLRNGNAVTPCQPHVRELASGAPGVCIGNDCPGGVNVAVFFQSKYLKKYFYSVMLDYSIMYVVHNTINGLSYRVDWYAFFYSDS